MASRMPKSLPFSRPVMASIVSRELRWSHGFAMTKMVALLGWLARLRRSKPASATKLRTAGS